MTTKLSSLQTYFLNKHIRSPKLLCLFFFCFKIFFDKFRDILLHCFILLDNFHLHSFIRLIIKYNANSFHFSRLPSALIRVFMLALISVLVNYFFIQFDFLTNSCNTIYKRRWRHGLWSDLKRNFSR